MITLSPVPDQDQDVFRKMVEVFWQEIMPKAGVLQTSEQRDGYYAARFSWAGGNHHPHWALKQSQVLGFVVFALSETQKQAIIEIIDNFIFKGGKDFEPSLY